MGEKSYVSMEQRVCRVCCQTYDTNSILLDKRMRPSMERNTVTGWGLCPEHEKLFNEGYIALVEAKSPSIACSHLTPDKADRTGVVVHIRRGVACQIFNVAIPENLDMLFVEVGVVDKIKAMVGEDG